MRVFLESVLPCDADRAWGAVRTSALLLEVARPLVAICPLPGEALPERWPANMTVRVRTYLLGLIPLGTRAVTFERIDDERREIQTREWDPLVRRWDHRMWIEPIAEGRCRYTDELEVEAGLLTPFVWLFTYSFYSHRQRRWQAVARRLQGGQ